uniref:UBR-type domain-containing protein n=1 Tax=Haemonchus contortus TaxID=6289 RepID=A0A7I5E6H0_HAECO
MLEKRIDCGLLSAVCSQLLEECTPSKLVFLSSQIFGGANCSLTTAAQHASVCRQLIERLSAVPIQSFRPEEWADIVSCFAENRNLPAELIDRYCPSDIWKHSSETSTKAASESNKAENLLLRSNRSSLVSTGLLGRILNSLWPRERLAVCVEQLLANKRFSPDDIILNNAVHVFDILDSDWVSLGTSLSNYSIPFIAGALACLDSAISVTDSDSAPVVDLPLGCSLVESVIRSFAPFSFGDSEMFEHIFVSFAKLLQKSSKNTSQLMRLVKALEGLTVWIDFTAAKCSQLPYALWNSVSELLILLEQQMEQSAKEVTATAKAVPIASPEEPTNDDTVAGNWLECILEQVPAMLDHQSAVQSQIVSEIVEISKRIEFLLRMLASARDLSKCNKSISDVAEKIQNLSNPEIVGEFQSTYIALSQGGSISADLQTKLLHDVLSRDGQQKTLLLRTIISGGRSNRPQLVAQIFKHSLDCYQQAIGSKDITERICREECVILEEFSHSLKRTHATEYSRQTLSLLEKIISDENPNVVLVDGITSLLLTLIHRNQEGPWTLDLKMLGRIESEWSKIINSFAEFSLRHPSQSFLSGTYSLLISEHFCGAGENLDLPVLLFVLRHLPRLISDQGQRDVQNFNNHHPGMEAIIKQFVHPDNVSKLADRAVKLFTETLNEGCWQIYVQSFILTVLIIESTGNRLGTSLFESFTNLLHNIDIHEVKDVCIGYEATGGIDRLHCMLSIFRNTAFSDLVPCFEEQCRQALTDEVLTKLIANNQRSPRKSDLSTFLKGEDESCGGNTVDEYLLHQHLRHEIATLLLHEVQEKWKSRPDKDAINVAQVKWVVRASCSGQYSREIAERAEQELSKLGADNAAEVRFCYLSETLLAGATSAQSVQRFERKPLLGFFCAFYESVLCNEKVKPSWIEDHLVVLGDTLDKCASAESVCEQTTLTPAFIQVLSNVLQKDSTSELSKQLRCLLAGRLLFLPSWLRCSYAPCALILNFAPILQDLKEHVDAEVMHCAMRDSVAAILRPSLIEDLHDFFKITVQSTDRLAQTALTWTGRLALENNRPSSLVPLGRREDVFHEVLMVICSHADTETHIEVLRHCAENLASWIGVSTDEENVMRGQTLLTNGNRLVFRLMVVSNLLEYCSELGKHAEPYNSDTYFSDSETLKNIVTRRGGPTALPTVERRIDETRSNSIPLCTYAATEKEFVHQHWYNCHTCKMTDNKGVCSVCAVNCHRGHDLSYSKQGSFFCDCGAGGCSALKATVYHNSPISAARGRTAPAVHTTVDNGSAIPVSFEIHLDTTFDSSELMELLDRVRAGIESRVEVIERIIRASLHARDSRWSLDERRDNVRRSLADPERLRVVYDQAIMEDYETSGKPNSILEPRRPPEPPTDRNKARDICQVLPFENGCHLWFMLAEHATTLQIFHMHPGQSLIDEIEHMRIDSEPIGFAGRQVSCRDDKVAVAGPSDILTLRMSKDGEIIDRMVIKLTELTTTHSNPIVKVLWAPNRPALLAVATVQLVRIYDLALDADNFVEELVLPVGNVEDIELIHCQTTDEMWLMVLSTSGHLYEHKLTARSADNTSFFLTNTVTLPQTQQILGAGVSVHYSSVSELLFLSLEKGTWFAPLEKGDLGRADLSLNWIKLDMTTPVHCWQESSGVMACFSYPIASSLVFVYPTLEQILIQKVPLKRSAFAHALFTGSSADMIYSMPLFYDSPTNLVFSARWSNLPDLWIENMPSEMCAQAEKEKEEPEAELQDSDLVTLFERCEPVDRVEVSCPDLAIFYDVHDLNMRLGSVGSMPVTAIQKEQFALTMRVGDPNIIVRAVRVELPAERGRGPSEVSIGDKTYPLTMTTDLARFFDIRFTRTQSLELDHRNITLTFSGRSRSQVGMTIVSVRLYGMSKREFGFPRSHLIARMPLSLPDKFILNVVRMLTTLNTRNLIVKDRDWMIKTACRLISPRLCHRELVEAANRLLRVLLVDSTHDYYARKDMVIINDLAVFSRGKVPIPSDLMADFALQLKYMMCTRWKQFWSIVKRKFGSSVAIMSFLRREVTAAAAVGAPFSASDPLPALELYTVLLFILLSVNDTHGKQLTDEYLSLYTDPKTSHIAHRVRLVGQTLVYSFALTTRNDRSQARSMNPTAKVMRWGGLRPFFNRTKILSPEDDPVQLEFLMGPLCTVEALTQRNSDMFDLESEWLLHLLQAVLAKIRDEGSIGSLPIEGVPVGRGDTVPSTSLLIFAMALMAQLYPANLYPTVVQLIAMVNWKASIVEINDHNYRQFLLFRLIFVLLLKCGEHLENRKKNDKETEEKRTGSSTVLTDVDTGSPSGSVPSGAVDFGTSADGSREATPINSSDERTTTKRRSTEKLLAQIVNQLCNAGALEFCRDLLESVASYWRTAREHRTAPRAWSRDSGASSSESSVSGISSGATGVMDAREHYYTMITDVALRLPCQMRKILSDVKFDERWQRILCELVSYQHAPQLRRQSKKVLLAMFNGDKQKYREVRDQHMMRAHIELLKKKYAQSSHFNHQQLTEMVEIVSAVAVTANQRTALWRSICEEQLNWLLQLACRVADAVSCSVVDLLVSAIRETPGRQGENIHLADKIIYEEKNRCLLMMLLVRYLIGRDENRRWLMHGLLRSTIQLASRQNQMTLLRILWNDLWPLARGLGDHAAQLADILSTYASRLFSSSEMQAVCDAELEAISATVARIEKEGHAGWYRQMTGLGLGWKTMLMDTSPCLVCFSRKDVAETVKLNSIKQEARFAANAMMLKLTCHYEISKVTIKLTDVKRNKMIKRVNLFYCPKTVESAVELKTCPELWQRASTCSVSANDTEIVLPLAIPVVTASLVIQFSELTESRQNQELHCPRCSSVVQPNPGLCEHCGENVFQCVKCRAINYDEKDPFLCQSCGFCKYARMDISLVCRPLPGVQPITTDAERASCVEAMARLLCDMEQTRSQLAAGRALSESLWLQSRPLPPISFHVESPDAANALIAALPPINHQQPAIHALLMTTTHCKALHEELCLQTQQLIAFREELRGYDRSVKTAPLLHQAINQGFYNASSNCFGCLRASILHSLAILQSSCDDVTCLERLLDSNIVFGTLVDLANKYEPIKEEIEMLLCRLSLENEKGTAKLCDLVMSGKISGTVLARSLNTFPDSLWQQKFRGLLKSAMKFNDHDTTLAALTIIDKCLVDAKPTRKRIYRKLQQRRRGIPSEISQNLLDRRRIKIANYDLDDCKSFGDWLYGKMDYNNTTSCQAPPSKKPRMRGDCTPDTSKEHDAWLWRCLFSPWIAVRAAAAKIIVAVAAQPGHLGAAVSVLLRGLPMASVAPPAMTDHFFRAAHAIIGGGPGIKARLYAEGLHVWLIKVIYKECKRMHEEEQQETSTDHSFGTLLRSYVELLCLLLTGSGVESLKLKAARDHILVPLFQSTIFLKRVLLRRTRAVEASRCSLERLLRRISAKDPLMLMRAAVQSLDAIDDLNTQAHIVSVILDVLNPEQKEEEDFHIQIEKDPAQEDFLQGRMTGNPYKSTDVGLGPLMRDIKNKICRDTEMIALMEDDNGMELLVNNQIISLSLPVRAVYDKLWKKANPGQPMVIVYRMRGLLGDAVESFVSTLGEADGGEAEEDETLSSLTGALSQCGGLTRALRLLALADTGSAGRFLLGQLRKLFERCVKTEQGRVDLVSSGAINAFMKVLHSCVSLRSTDEGVLQIGLEYLQMISAIVNDPAVHPILTGISKEDAEWLLSFVMAKPDSGTESVNKFCAQVSRVIGNLVVGNEEAEKALIAMYIKTCQWKEIDETNDVSLRSERVIAVGRLCEVTAGILNSVEAAKLKQKILDSGVLSKACSHLVSNHPPLYSATESQEWKAFLLRPSLKLMLSFMHGMAKSHEASQRALAEKTLHILHRLEQVASDNSIGTMAENVVEALKENTEVAAQIENVRQETRQKKRQMAMAMRNKQLREMGMQMGKSGEVKVAHRRIANEPALEGVTDPLASCCICREPLFQGTRVSAAYAFASPLTNDARVPQLVTVSQMVMVHIDCHQNAIRRSGGGRNVDEWSKASLHNAGAKCNALTPIAIGTASEADWALAINRYQADLEVAAPVPPLCRAIVFVDICELIDKFVYFRSFSEASQGGGRESNAQYLAVLHLLALCLPPDELPTRNARHRVVSFLMTELTLQSWLEQRVDVLRAALADYTTEGHANTWDSLRPVCLTWAFVDRYFRDVIPIDSEDRLEWLQSHILETLHKTSTFVKKFDEEIAPLSAPEPFCELMDIPLDQIGPHFAAANDANV